MIPASVLSYDEVAFWLAVFGTFLAASGAVFAFGRWVIHEALAPVKEDISEIKKQLNGGGRLAKLEQQVVQNTEETKDLRGRVDAVHDRQMSMGAVLVQQSSSEL